MDGLLVVDKPSGPTSHDVVARLRRLLKEKRIGHTGTLDPMASGVLPLVIGRATRLARFMASDDKRYDAIVRLGFATDTYDAMGAPVGNQWNGPWPDAEAINRALGRFRGTFLQQPPAYSAKKVGGERSYRLARRARATSAERRGASAERGAANDEPLVASNEQPAPSDEPRATSVEPRATSHDLPAPTVSLPSPAEVTAFAIDITSVDGDRVSLAITCSAGFYVRSLAHDLGQELGVGAHLASLRRTATSGVTLNDAVTLDDLEGGRRPAADAVVPLERLVPHLPSVHLSAAGAMRAAHGQDLGPADLTGVFPEEIVGPGPFRLVDSTGALMGIAERSARSGLLHPAVILM